MRVYANYQASTGAYARDFLQAPTQVRYASSPDHFPSPGSRGRSLSRSPTTFDSDSDDLTTRPNSKLRSFLL